MIKESEVMPLLLIACPSFSDKWRAHCVNWGTDEPGLYNAFSELVYHMVDCYKEGLTEEFKDIFNVIEKLNIDGDEYVQEAVVIGFLESLQNYAGNNGVNPVLLVKYLLPETRKWWIKLNEFWVGK